MKPLDRFFQRLRFQAIRPYVRPGVRLLDIGCGDGALFAYLQPQVREGLGLDPFLDRVVERGSYRLIPGAFPEGVPAGAGPFDVVTMLAMLEHVPADAQAGLARACAALLAPGGLLLITVPSPVVDHILHALRHLPFLYEGKSLEQHHGFDVSATPAIFSSLTLVRASTFEFGLNHLFIFRKPGVLGE